MSDEHKTVKLPPFDDKAAGGMRQSNLTREQEIAVELVKKNVLLEDAKKESLGQIKTIEQLQQRLDQEQARSAGLQAKINELSELLSKISDITAKGKAD